MSAEATVKVYWPGPAFTVIHHAAKVVIANDESAKRKCLIVQT